MPRVLYGLFSTSTLYITVAGNFQTGSKKGKHSVGVARQYCGQLGKQDNCQVAVSISLANEHFSLPVRYQLYLPQSWADDPQRRKHAKVPEALEFVTKPMLALQLLENLGEVGSLPELVLADAGYGASTEFREQLTAMGFTYMVGVTGTVSLQSQALAPLQAKELAMQLPSRRFRTVTWREGTNCALSSRFAAVRVHCASRAARPGEASAEQWLLIEWPKAEVEPTKYFLSTLPADTPIKELVRLAKLRWRIERDYQELKQELGLGHFEGRNWRGFHHHATLCIAAYGFLVTERLVVQKKRLCLNKLLRLHCVKRMLDDGWQANEGGRVSTVVGKAGDAHGTSARVG